MNSAAKKLEKFFFALLIINPFIDLIGGIYIRLSTLDLDYEQMMVPIPTPSLYIRMAVLLVFGLYLVLRKDKQSIMVLLPIGVCWALTVAGEFLFAIVDFSLMEDVKYIAKFGYNLCVMLVYWRVFQNSGLSREQILHKLNYAFAFTLNLFSATIIISNILGIGYTTYADKWGYRGSRGFFYSGNDLTAVLMILLPLAIIAYMQLQNLPEMKKKQRFFWLFAPASTIAAMITLGTKTAYIAVLASVITFYVHGFLQKRKGNREPLKRFNKIMLAFIITFAAMMLLTQAAILADISLSLAKIWEIRLKQGLGGAFFSGRILKFLEVLEVYKDTGAFAWIFGVGRGTQETIIEMDVLECWMYYGIGMIPMLWLYVKQGVDFLKKYFSNKDLAGLGLLVSIGLGTAFMILAGHVLFSVTSGFYYSLVMLYAAIYYSPQIENLNLLPKWWGRKRKQLQD